MFHRVMLIFDLSTNYKQMATVDDLAQEIEELRQALAMHHKPMSGNNRRYAPRARVNRVRIYR